MTRLDTAARVLVVAAMLVVVSIFSRATPLTLVALVLGGAMVVLGSLYSYRPGGMMGMVIVAIGAASSIHIDSLFEVRTVLTAVLGLLLPLFLLALHALRVEEGDLRAMAIRSKPALVALAFCLFCVLSAPMVAGLASLILPAVTIRLTCTAEIAIVLLTATVGSVILTRRTSSMKTVSQTAETGANGAE